MMPWRYDAPSVDFVARLVDVRLCGQAISVCEGNVRLSGACLQGVIELELALRSGRSEAELRKAVRSAAEETDRLSQLAEDLLVIARADHGRLPVRLAEVTANGPDFHQHHGHDLDG